MNEPNIKAILARKRANQDCTEAESAELKQFVLKTNLTIENIELIKAIEYYFPAEYSEALEMMPPNVRQAHLDHTAELTVQANEETSKTKSAHEVINMIADTLREANGKWIADIANKVLTEKVTYKEDSYFKIE